MARIFRWGFWFIAALFALIIFLLIIGYITLVKSVPADNGEATLPALRQEVKTVFDQHAIPHIEAENYEDAIRAMGYMHARDRMWQMEVLRVVGEGRMSELFGEATFETDVFLRTLGMGDASRRSFDALLPQTRQALRAYSEGVNAYLETKGGLIDVKLSAEFLAFGRQPERWEPWHSILIVKVMGLTLGHNMNKEIQRFKMAMRGFTSQEIDDLVTYGPRDNPPKLPNLLSIYNLDAEPAKKAGLKKNQIEQPIQTAELFIPTGKSASNNWVVSGARTDTGAPILANDPHLGLTAPSTFYLAHMSWKEDGARKHVIGGTLPGVPFVVVGRTSDFAWGLTTTNLDSQDLFLEKLDTSAGTYVTENGYAPLEVSKHEIKIGSSETRTIEVHKTRNGPLLPSGYKSIGEFLPGGYGFALAWPGMADDDTTLDMLAINNKSKSVDQFFSAINRSVSPMQSIVVGDTKGNIGLAAVARIPRRSSENLIQGRAPVPGWMDKYQWQGYAPLLEQFMVSNPARGALATANANFNPKPFDTHYSFDWAEHFRQQRVEELVLDAKDKHTVQASIDFMGDTYSHGMVSLRDVALRVLPKGSNKLSGMINRLAEWDGKMEKSRPEPLIMLAWLRHLHSALFEDDLKDVYPDFSRGRVTPVIRILSSYTSRDWCDDLATDRTEGCEEILTSSLQAAVDELTAKYGSDWRVWRYGAEHSAFHEHRPFSRVPLLNKLFTIETPMSGGPYTLLRAQPLFNTDRPYVVRHGAAYRAVYDFSDMDKSKFMISTGQSGNVMSKHYDDLAEPWANVEFVPMTTNREDYRRGAIGTWLLKP